MGIFLSEAIVLREWTAVHGFAGPILALGVISTTFSTADYALATNSAVPNASFDSMPAKLFFQTCGIDELVSLDISGYEGADVIFDLNGSEPPSQLIGRFGMVLNHGTLEHVFHLPNALSNISRMLKPDGVVIHIAPVHNWVDHGFYQFGPTLLFDYYHAARFDILESAAFIFKPLQERSPVMVLPSPPGQFGTGLGGGLDDRAVMLMFAARKSQQWIADPVPLQTLYADGRMPRPLPPRWFPPFKLENGLRVTGSDPLRVPVTSFVHEQGLLWKSGLPAYQEIADVPANPIRSSLALFEDGKLLGPPHTVHAVIRKHGGGAYSHWADTLFLSSSDGSAPDRNGRTYMAVIPDLGWFSQ